MALTRATDKIIGNDDGNLNLSGIVTASSFRGDGSQLTGVDASTLKNGNDTKAQANASGVVVTGVLTATSFRGDGSNLTNLPAGLGTALSSTQTSPLNKLYYTNRVLSIDSTTTVDHPATGTGAYTQYAEIQIEDNADLIIEDGDDLIPDILGLGDNGSTGAGGLGRLRVDTITNKSANGAPNFPNGLTGTSGTFTGNLNVGGVLTYEDVTNVDSVGVITARNGGYLDIRTGSSINTNVTGTAASGTLHKNTNSGEFAVVSGGTGGNNYLSFYTSASAAPTEKLRIDSSGKIGISRTPTEHPLEIQHGSEPTVSLWRGSTKGAALQAQSGGTYLYSYENAPLVFSVNSGSGFAERMRITQDGYVTKPNNPSFHARLINHTNATANPLVYDDVLVNVGSHYKSSGSDAGKFVVPVAGTYFFFWEAIKNGSSGVTRVYLQKNGARTYNSMHLRIQEEGNYANGCMNVIMTLAVGDKIHTELAAGGVHASEYTHFGGYLIG